MEMREKFKPIPYLCSFHSPHCAAEYQSYTHQKVHQGQTGDETISWGVQLLEMRPIERPALWRACIINFTTTLMRSFVMLLTAIWVLFLCYMSFLEKL